MFNLLEQNCEFKVKQKMEGTGGRDQDTDNLSQSSRSASAARRMSTTSWNNQGNGAAVKTGRKGDPRMHRAVAARLADPKIPLFDALKIGGFEYQNDEDSNAVDSENVSLAQRKNQLSRRVRLAKRQNKGPKDVDKSSNNSSMQNIPGIATAKAEATGGSRKGGSTNLSGHKHQLDLQETEDGGLDDDPAARITGDSSVNNAEEMPHSDRNLIMAKHHPDYHPIVVGPLGTRMVADPAGPTVDGFLLMNHAYQQMGGTIVPATYNQQTLRTSIETNTQNIKANSFDNNTNQQQRALMNMMQPNPLPPSHNGPLNNVHAGTETVVFGSNKTQGQPQYCNANQANTLPAQEHAQATGNQPISVPMNISEATRNAATTRASTGEENTGNSALTAAVNATMAQQQTGVSGVAISSLLQTAASAGMTLEQLAMKLRSPNAISRILHPDSAPMQQQQSQQDLAVAFYLNENRSLYSKCMLMAGFSPDIANNENSAQYMQIALTAWQQEGQRLESIMNHRCCDEAPLVANAPGTGPGGDSSGSGPSNHGGGQFRHHHSDHTHHNHQQHSHSHHGQTQEQKQQQQYQQDNQSRGNSTSSKLPCCSGGRHIHRLEGRCGHKAILHQPADGAAHIDFVVGNHIECYQEVQPKSSNQSNIKVWPSRYKCQDLRCRDRCQGVAVSENATSGQNRPPECIVVAGDPKTLDLGEIDLDGDEWNPDFATGDSLLGLFKLGAENKSNNNEDKSSSTGNTSITSLPTPVPAGGGKT